MSLMLFLGFADDVLDLRWSIKIFFSFLAAFPLLMAYTGATVIIIPRPLRFEWLGLSSSLELGLFYQFYMACMVVFCTNSINIFAGINGLETGQSVVIATSMLVHNFFQLQWGTRQEIDGHILSIFLLLPFLAANLGLLYFNWYPSEVFVGDTFTYFAGVTFAVAGVLGHFSKTLMILFVPQLINFIYSLPQLFHIVPCPRHRLPRLNRETRLLEPSYVPEVGVMNMTVLNLWLRIFGPKSERRLCVEIILFQIFCTIIALYVRYSFESYFY